jgi:hypothetical protein
MAQRGGNSLRADTCDPPRRSVKKFAAGAAGIAVILFGYYALIWQSHTALNGVRGSCPNLFCDFALYYYPMGEAVFQTGLPVMGFLYSPFIAILLTVFSPLGLNTSLVLWGMLQVVFVILYLLCFRRLVPAGLAVQLLFVALVFSSYPVVVNLWWGQVSVFIMVALLGMLVLSGHGHRTAAAGFLALAVSIKFYPIMFVAPFALRRDIRSVLYAAGACAAFLFVIPGVLLGPGGTLGFYGALLDAFRDSDWVVANPHSCYFPHVVLRLAGAAGYDMQAHLSLLCWIGFGTAAVNMGLIYVIERARLRHADLWSFQLVFLTIPFLLKTSWPHDFVFLSFTQAFLAWWLLTGSKITPGTDGEARPPHAGSWRKRILNRRAAIAFLLLLPSIVLSNIFFFILVGDFDSYGFYAFFFWANLSLLVALYVELLPPALRHLREARTA